ncbi:hypothetical protein D3C86_1722140 [compost metagenome]
MLSDWQLRKSSKCAQPMMDRVAIGLAHLATHLPRRRVRRDTLLTHQCGELFAPLAQSFLSDIEPLAGLELMLALDHEVYVRVRLVRMQHQRIAILQCEVLACEHTRSSQHLRRRRTGRHR